MIPAGEAGIDGFQDDSISKEHPEKAHSRHDTVRMLAGAAHD